MRDLRYKISKLLIPILWLTTTLGATIGAVPTAFAVTAATVSVPGTVSVSAGSATTNITGISVGGLSAGTTYLVAIGISNTPTGAFLKLPSTTGLTASYGFTSGANTFSSFKNISFRGNLTDVNSALAALQYVSGATGSATNPSIRITATSYDAGYSLNGLNGHYYKSSSPTTKTYTDARTAAKALTYKGMPGYLVTITSSEENSFVASNIESAASVWIGATDELTEGDWKWDTNGGSPEAGTSFWSGLSGGSAVNGNYQSWNPGLEPNDASGEDYAVTNWGGSSNGLWNDCNNGGCGSNRLYVIEFGNNSDDAGFVNPNSDLGSGTFSLSYKPILTGVTNSLNAILGTILYETVTATAGTGNKNFTLTNSPANSGITIDTSITNRALLKIGNNVGAGTYTSTITATDSAGISSTYVVTTNISNPSGSETDSALSLNGSDQFASFVDNTDYNVRNNITLEAWTYTTSASSNGVVIGKESEFLLMKEGGYWKYYLQGTSGWAGVSTNIPVVANEWHHVALTRASATNTINFYLDGFLAFTGSADGWGTGQINDSANDFVIGSHNKNSSFFAGKIDEVRVWNVVRSQSDIQSDLKTYGGSLATGLVAYYDFNELVGSRLLNRSTGGSSLLDLTTSNAPSLSSVSIESTYLAYTVTTFPRTYLVAAGGWKIPSGISSVKSLVVGGGGAGGSRSGGGGGAGGYVFDGSLAVTPNSTQAVVVGVGGTVLFNASDSSGKDGTFSAFGTLRYALGGGGGGWNGLANNTYRVGKSGGSGGGAASNYDGYASATVGSSTQTSTYGYGVGFSGGSSAPGGRWPAGGGGGAGSTGGNGNNSTNTGGKGGSGLVDPIAGTSTCYATGGGGGIYTGYTGGAGGDCGGASNPNTNAATSGANVPTSAKANTGSGGGGAGYSSDSNLNDVKGGNGASGVVIIAYITNTPTIITQPLSDTTTAGIVETFTVTTNAVPVPLTKSVQWQFTADTTTGTTGWTNVSTGTGGTTDTFTTAALTKSMNKYRYRAIVTFSDTSTLSVVETSTVAILTINDSITISSSTTAMTQKYGNTQVVRALAYSGGTTSTGAVGTSTSHTVSSTNGPLSGGKIYLDTSTSTTYIKVDTGTAAGSYNLNVTITDFKGATSSYNQSIVVSQADTLTVQADTLTAITYSPSGMTINPTTTITGLVASDTSSAVTITFSEPASTCASGGSCSLGDTGPGGGTIFYISGSTYYEAAPKNWYSTFTYRGSTYDNSFVKFCSDSNGVEKNVNFGFTASTGWGGGKTNTTAFVNNGCPTGAIALSQLYQGGSKTDWYVPNATELNELQSYWNNRGAISSQFTNVSGGDTPYWTSNASWSGAQWGWIMTYPFFNSSGTWNLNGAGYNNQTGVIVPIRYFTASGGTQNLVGNPTNAGTYTLTPSALTLANGVSTSNYVNVVYRTSQFTINKAAQSTLVITSKLGDFRSNPSFMKLITSGGSDTGTVTYAIASGGSAGGCAISGESLTVSSAGTCKVVATKAATRNYLVAYSDTVTVTFSLFISNQQVQTQSVPTQLPINGANALDTATVGVSTLLISSVTKTGSGAHTVAGTGFSNIEIVRIGGTDLTGSNYSVSSSTSITLSGVASLTGPLFIRKTDGQETVYFQFDWS